MRVIRRIVVLLIGLMLLLPLNAAASLHAFNPQSSVLSPSSRPWAPVILTASQLPDLLDTPTAHLTVWAYRDGQWQTIPSQVDEKAATGYVAQGDGQFNGTDELVFMLEDLGEPGPLPLPAYDVVQVVTVADSLAPDAALRVAYVARVATPAPPAIIDYIDYDATTRRLHSQRYRMGLDAAHPFINHLALNGSDVNLLDRSKIRMVLNACFFGMCLTFTEEQLPLPPLTPLKDGPVRVVLSRAGSFAYRDWLILETAADLSDVPDRLLYVQLRLDLAPGAQGAVYRDANRPDGVTIDGAPDAVPSLPYSPWRQIDHPSGRLVSLFTVLTPHRRLLNFYADRAAQDVTDTGDRQSHGEHGVVVDEPEGQSIAVNSALWALPATATLDGAQLAAQHATPLTITVMRAQYPRLYLPYLTRNP